MISWPAAKQIRWVNPSIATVSPSRTRSATASRIETTLFIPPLLDVRVASGVWGPAVLRPAEDAELVPLRVLHHRPEAASLVDACLDRRAELLEPSHLGRHRSARAEVDVDAVLDRLRLGDGLEVQPVGHPGGIEHAGSLRIRSRSERRPEH